jgi:hypothetical protein
MPTGVGFGLAFGIFEAGMPLLGLPLGHNLAHKRAQRLRLTHLTPRQKPRRAVVMGCCSHNSPPRAAHHRPIWIRQARQLPGTGAAPGPGRDCDRPGHLAYGEVTAGARLQAVGLQAVGLSPSLI